MNISELKDSDEILFVDIETRSSIDIKIAGTVKYATDAEMILGGFRLKDKYHVYDISSDPSIPVWATDHIMAAKPVAAHNYLFDYLVLRQYVPWLTLEQGIDTMALCAAHSIPLALDKAGEALNIPLDKRKLAEGKRLIRKFCTPNKYGSYDSPLEYPAEWEKFKEYLYNDIEAMREITHMIPMLTPDHHRVWLETQYVNLEGIPIDVNMVEFISSKLDPLVDEESSKFIRITGLFPNQNMKFLNWINDHGYKMDNLQSQNVTIAINDSNTPAIVKEALEIRANTTHASFKKYDTMKYAVMDDDHIRGCFIYHAATTGRWGGRLLQPHNLTRGKIDGEEAIQRLKQKEFSVELVKSAVRPMIYCEEGFTIADYSGIEARVVQWLAEDEDALDIFRQGLDPYKWMAQRIYSVAYEDVTDRQRFAGKQAILGLGYSMSALKFQSTVAGYGEHIELNECRKIVEIYRNTHHKLVALWQRMMKSWCEGLNAGGQIYEVNKYISFQLNYPWYYMILPSGRKLAYYKPVLPTSSRIYDLEYWAAGIGGKWGKEQTYGGKLVENAVQAISADILASAISRLLERGYRIPMHVHDEIVVRGDIGVQNMIDTMCELPNWAEGLPLTAAGEYVTRFKKL